MVLTKDMANAISVAIDNRAERPACCRTLKAHGALYPKIPRG